jgi:hypothetical protein
MVSRGNRPLTVDRCCGSMFDARKSTGAPMRPHIDQELGHRAWRAVLVGEAQAQLRQPRPDDADNPTS